MTFEEFSGEVKRLAGGRHKAAVWWNAFVAPHYADGATPEQCIERLRAKLTEAGAT